MTIFGDIRWLAYFGLKHVDRQQPTPQFIEINAVYFLKDVSVWLYLISSFGSFIFFTSSCQCKRSMFCLTRHLRLLGEQLKQKVKSESLSREYFTFISASDPKLKPPTLIVILRRSTYLFPGPVVDHWLSVLASISSFVLQFSTGLTNNYQAL